MNPVVTILLSVLVFGFLIFVHEFGHYITARIFKVTILEFSIGMGPRLITWKSKKTGIQYSIAAIPFGGFVSMAGEDGTYPEEERGSEAAEEIYGPSSGVPAAPVVIAEADGEPEYKGELAKRSDPNGFDKKPAWQRFIITIAGASINIIAGFIAMIIYTSVTGIGATEVYDFPEKSFEVRSEDSGLMAGDVITHVDGVRVGIADELSYEIMRRGYEPIDLTVIREGKTLTLTDVVFPTDTQSGQTFGVMDFRVVGKRDKSFVEVLSFSVRKSVLMMRMCWESLFDLITGRYTLEAVSGPVGISGAIGEAAAAGAEPLLYMVAMISINLGVMNLLPIPALDGGRTITLIAEMITRKRIPPKVENAVNTVGLMVLLGFSFLILIKDVLSIIF